MRRFLKAIGLAFFGMVFVACAVANRHAVRFVVDPFIDRDAALSFSAPLFVFLFAALFLGLIIGASAMWIGQSHWRRLAKKERHEATVWRREAENLKRGLQTVSGPQQALPQSRGVRSYI